MLKITQYHKCVFTLQLIQTQKECSP